MRKIVLLLSSIRFWMLAIATCSVLAAHYAPSLEFLFNTIAGFLASVVGIGTADKMSSGKVNVEKVEVSNPTETPV